MVRGTGLGGGELPSTTDGRTSSFFPLRISDESFLCEDRHTDRTQAEVRPDLHVQRTEHHTHNHYSKLKGSESSPRGNCSLRSNLSEKSCSDRVRSSVAPSLRGAGYYS